MAKSDEANEKVVPAARTKEVLKAKGEPTSDLECDPGDWECKAWQQTSLNQQSERRVRIVKAIFWPTFTVILVLVLFWVIFTYAPAIMTWFEGLFSGLIPSF